MGSFTELPEGTYCHGYVSGNAKESRMDNKETQVICVYKTQNEDKQNRKHNT
jgi:hypothetical protein